MNLGFDLDKVFIDYPPLIPPGLIDALYKNRKKKLQYRIPKRYEQLVRDITHMPLLRPLIKENFGVLKLKSFKRKHKHFLISSRFSFLEKRTNAIIERHRFNELFDGMFFNFKNEQPHFFKNRIIQKLKVKKYIDDDLELLKYLSDKNPNAVFFWLNNSTDKKITKNLFAITRLEKFFKE